MVYGGLSQTPWVRVLQLPVFRFSPFSQQAEFHLAFVHLITIVQQGSSPESLILDKVTPKILKLVDGTNGRNTVPPT